MKVGIVGASGYTGGELLRLLLRHPEVEITVLTAERHKGRKPEEVFGSLRGMDLPEFSPFEPEVIERADLFFLALPHGTAMRAAKEILQKGKRVIDLSADFRFRDPEVYEKWYGQHECPELLPEAVYGLPELYREQIRGARLVANPGCYPTSVLLALLPLAERGMIDGPIIVDSKSGVSGAGRGLQEGTLFCEVAESVRAYGVLRHRHIPEMEGQLGRLTGQRTRVYFVPHLIPMNRGILSTIYVNLKSNMGDGDLYALYLERFQKEPFIRICPPGTFPSTASVRGSNFCDIGFTTQGNKAVIVSAIDNLTKGASGQAVQNMNIMLDFPETLALETTPLFP